MASPEFFVEYFTRPAALLILGGLHATALLAYATYVVNKRPRVRILMLDVLFAAGLTMWIFIISSLIFCEVYDHVHPGLPLMEVKVVMGWASATAMALGIPLALAVSARSSSVLTKDLHGQGRPDSHLLSLFREVREVMGMPDVVLVSIQSPRLTCFSIGGRERRIVVSANLQAHLSDEELRSIFAHEMAHLMNGDTRVRAMLSVYSRLLWFDPILRLVKAATDREMEFRADDVAAKSMGGPGPLARALTRLAEINRGPPRVVSDVGTHLFASHPPVRVRIHRLLTSKGSGG